MTAGFEVYKPNGKIAISSFYPHYRLVKVIKWGGGMGGLGNFYDSVGYPYSKHVLVAFRCQEDGLYSTFRFSKGAISLWIPAAPPPPNTTLSMHSEEACYAYIFDIPLEESKSGLNVFNTKKEITFSSEYYFMNFLKVCNGRSIGKSKFDFPGVEKVAITPIKKAITIKGDGRGGEQEYCISWFTTEKGSATEWKVCTIDDYTSVINMYNSHLPFSFLAVNVDHIPTP